MLPMSMDRRPMMTRSKVDLSWYLDDIEEAAVGGEDVFDAACRLTK